MYLTLYDTNEQTKTCKDKQENYLNKAAICATKSNVKNQRHGCVIVKDGEIVSEGFNHHTDHFEHKFTIHAEVDALFKLKKSKYVASDCELYVVRIGTDSMKKPLKYSRPCCDCTKAILKAGIKKVYFSTDDEFDKMIKDYIPPGSKKPQAQANCKKNLNNIQVSRTTLNKDGTRSNYKNDNGIKTE